jgi:hypothetical protein
MTVEAGAPGGPTPTEDYQVLKVIEAVEARFPLADWGNIVPAVQEQLAKVCPSVLHRFDITWRLRSGVLDEHLAPVYTPRSAVDRLADVAGRTPT